MVLLVIVGILQQIVSMHGVVIFETSGNLHVKLSTLK